MHGTCFCVLLPLSPVLLFVLVSLIVSTGLAVRAMTRLQVECNQAAANHMWPQ